MSGKTGLSPRDVFSKRGRQWPGTRGPKIAQSRSSGHHARAVIFLVVGLMLAAAMAIPGPVNDPRPVAPPLLSRSSSISGWVYQTLDQNGSVGNYSSIAVDRNNYVHISYYDATNRALKYATNLGGTWATYTVDSSADVGMDTSIAIDSKGSVHISYLDWTDGNLKYATNADGTWATYTVDNARKVGMFSSIALDSNDKVHISYLDYSNYDLKYATNEGGSWVNTTLDSTGDVGFDTSIAVDSGNNVHVCYGDWTNNHLKYATNKGGSWANYTIDNSTDVGYDASIAVDSADHVHISYNDELNGTLKYATDVGGSWKTYTLDQAGNVGIGTSIAIDRADNVHISYCDYTNYSDTHLKYATNAGGPWVYYTLDSGGNVGLHSSIAVDSKGIVHICYTDFTNYDLRYLYGTEQALPEISAVIGVRLASNQTPLSVQFTVNVTGGLGPFTFSWNFGDGATSSEENPIHTYSKEGTYTASLVVTDILLNSKTVLRTLTVSNGVVIPASNGIDEAVVLALAAGVLAVIAVIVIVVLHVVRRGVVTKEQPQETERPKPAPAEVVAAPVVNPNVVVFQTSSPPVARPSGSASSSMVRPRVVRVEDKLLELRFLKQRGLISDLEYEAKMKELFKKW